LEVQNFLEWITAWDQIKGDCNVCCGEFPTLLEKTKVVKGLLNLNLMDPLARKKFIREKHTSSGNLTKVV